MWQIPETQEARLAHQHALHNGGWQLQQPGDLYKPQSKQGWELHAGPSIFALGDNEL